MAQQISRKNHFVPEWYQRRFFAKNSDKLFYLCLDPCKQLPNGRIISYREVNEWPPSRCFCKKDLYTTQFGEILNDEIERLLMGTIDTVGAKAVSAIAGGNPRDLHDALQPFFEYLDTQKLRTPKGLDWIKSKYPDLTQAELMVEMQGLRQMHCTMWAEGVREIISAESAAWVQCSPDQGLTFSVPAIASPTYASGNGSVSHPSGAIGPKGEIAIRWHGFPTEMLAGVNVAGLAVSTDGVAAYKNVSAPVYQEAGTAFSASVGDVRFDDAGVLWIVYGVYDGGQHDRIVVDKSCDLGATWSGSLVINALADGTIENATRASLVPTTGKTAVYVGAKLGDALNDSELRRYTLQQ